MVADAVKAEYALKYNQNGELSMRQLRIGVIGLGNIAQKAYLPILGQAKHWALAGAFSPNQQKAKEICQQYRMSCFSNISALAEACDAVFVHSSTQSHFSVVSELLNRGLHVYVDKPLAQTAAESEQLVELAQQKSKALMVGFNRRFAPLYQQLKQEMGDVATIRLDKHRENSITNTMPITMLDDYLHVVDTLLWLGNGHLAQLSGKICVNASGQMIFAEHHFLAGECLLTGSMHRCAGTQSESLQSVSQGCRIQVLDMRQWQIEQAGELKQVAAPGWQSTLEQRGFAGAINHFIQSIENQTAPQTSGEAAFKAQQMIETLIQKG